MKSIKRNIKLFLLLLISILAISPIVGYSGGADLWYFKEFFKRMQPKEYYEFVGGTKLKFESSKKIPHFYYEVIDDFKMADQWTISFGPDMMSFENPLGQIGSDPKETYIHWKNLDPLQPEYPHAATPTVESYKKDPTNTGLMGIRALFFGKQHRRIMVTPKNKVYLKKATNYFRLEMFVFGIGKNYDIFITIVTPEGDFKRVYLGNLNYFGWKHLSTDLKDYHIKSPPVTDFPLNRRIEIKNIYIESRTPYTDGFFGSWFSTLRYSYRVHPPQESGIALYSQFAWKGSAASQGIQPNPVDPPMLDGSFPSGTPLNIPNIDGEN